MASDKLKVIRKFYIHMYKLTNRAALQAFTKLNDSTLQPEQVKNDLCFGSSKATVKNIERFLFQI
uniref:Uncharacterized protein n=1 Tax=Rhizophagus irregularis (strain DAOM 181602 / DAOM 197198 / MUCL 43194) TaxID=747089 RepID=U9UPP0_RHIID